MQKMAVKLLNSQLLTKQHAFIRSFKTVQETVQQTVQRKVQQKVHIDQLALPLGAICRKCCQAIQGGA